MSDKHKLLALLKRRYPGEVGKPVIAKALNTYSVTQRVSEVRRDVSIKGWDVACREWTDKRTKRKRSAYRLVVVKRSAAA